MGVSKSTHNSRKYGFENLKITIANFQIPRVSDRQALLRDVTLAMDTLAMLGDENSEDFQDLMELEATIEVQSNAAPR